MAGNAPDAPQNSIPPYPWPDQSSPPWEPCKPGSAPNCLGGMGTTWFFNLSDLVARFTELGYTWDTGGDLESVLGFLYGKLQSWAGNVQHAKIPSGKLPDDPKLYYVNLQGAKVGMSLNTVRATVHAKLGTVEELDHVFHFAASSTGGVPANAGDLATLAGNIATAWHHWLVTSVDGHTPSDWFHPALVYDEVRASVVSYQQMATPAPRPNPVTVIPTVYAAMPSGSAGTAHIGGVQALPFEVALCVTLLTNARGRSNKGRTYLGGLDIGTLGLADGLFSAPAVQNIAKAFGTNFVGYMTTTYSQDLQVVSARSHDGNRAGNAWSAPSSRGVGGVRVGVVPDSQRRRRRSQQELYTVQWGTAP